LGRHFATNGIPQDPIEKDDHFEKDDYNMHTKLRNIDIFGYALPEFGIKMIVFPLIAIIPGFYAKNTELTLAVIGTIIFFSRFSDALTDPLVGYLSDKTSSPLGKRKPWMIGGTLLAVVSIYFLFTPASDASVVYFAGWLALAYLAWTMLDVPYKTWGAELSQNYYERSKVVTFRSMMGTSGGLLFLCLPFLPFLDTTEMSPELMYYAAIVIAILLPILVSIALILAPHNTATTPQQSSVWLFVKSLQANKPFLLFAGATIFGFIGLGANSTMIFFFVDSHLGIGEHLALILIVDTIINILAMPMWLKLSDKLSKHTCWAIAYFFPLFYYPVLFFVPIGADALWYMIAFSVGNGVVQSAIWLAPTSILADIIDYDTLKSKIRRGGLFFAAFMLMVKASMAIGSGLGVGMLDMFGFEAQGNNDSFATIGIFVSYAVFPLCCYLIGMTFILKFPIDKKRHSTITKRINSPTFLGVSS